MTCYADGMESTRHPNRPPWPDTTEEGPHDYNYNGSISEYEGFAPGDRVRVIDGADALFYQSGQEGTVYGFSSFKASLYNPERTEVLVLFDDADPDTVHPGHLEKINS